MAYGDNNTQVEPGAAAAALGIDMYHRGNSQFDFAKLSLQCVVDAIDSLLGYREYASAVPGGSAKAHEMIHAMWQHLIIASAAPYVFAEMGKTEYHVKAVVDAKLYAELRITRGLFIAVLNGMEDEPEGDDVAAAPAQTPGVQQIQDELGTAKPDDADKADEKQTVATGNVDAHTDDDAAAAA